MTTRIVPIAGKTAEIIETVMSSPDVPQDETLRFKIRLSVEEIAENIVNYAYNNGNGFVEITTTLDEAGMLTISFKDAGVPFNHSKKRIRTSPSAWTSARLAVWGYSSARR